MYIKAIFHYSTNFRDFGTKLEHKNLHNQLDKLLTKKRTPSNKITKKLVFPNKFPLTVKKCIPFTYHIHVLQFKTYALHWRHFMRPLDIYYSGVTWWTQQIDFKLWRVRILRAMK